MKTEQAKPDPFGEYRRWIDKKERDMKAETKLTHTPTPIQPALRYGNTRLVVVDGKIESENQAYWFRATVQSDNKKEDAAYIVQAVNAHEELLEAAKAARELSPLTDKSKWANVLNQLEQAIAKAEKPNA